MADICGTAHYEAGNLKSTEQQKVSVQTESDKQVIVIQPAQPQTVYVPVYQPTVVYGTWWYPAYPPYYWPPPPYYYPGGAFVAGFAWGVAIGGINNCLWGGFAWGRNDININVNHYNNINVNRPITTNNNTFVHNPDRRRDVPYRDARSRDTYAGNKQLAGASDREAYRGKDGRDAERARAAETLKDRGADPVAGREKLQGADRDKAAAAVRDSDHSPDRAADRATDRTGDRSRPAAPEGAGGRAEGFERPSGGSSSRPSSGGALSGARDSGASRANADRGRTSKQSMAQHRPAGGGARHR